MSIDKTFGNDDERRLRRVLQGGASQFYPRHHVRLPEPKRSRRERPRCLPEGCRGMAAGDALARHRRAPAAGRACPGRDAPIAPARRLLPRTRTAIPRCGARCRSPPTVQAIRREPGIASRRCPSGCGRRASISRKASSLRTSTCLRPRWRHRRSGAGSLRFRSCSRASSTITARTPSFAYAGTSTGFRPNGSSCTARTCARASSASSASRRRSVATMAAARSGRSSRSTSTRCSSISSTAATCRRPTSTGPFRRFARGAGASSSLRCRRRWRASSSTSPAAPGCCAAPARIRARCCATSIRRRSPSSST